ncbi:MAG: NB-ARC domain-containing protein [Candidatus Korobacteraceae bacterium]|jgi:WD40 repeat protein
MPKARSIFISYSRWDGADLAKRLRADLAANGFEPWLDARNIAGGDSWTDKIEQGIDAAYAVLAVLTPGSYASRICRAEQLRALRKGKLLIPLLATSGSDRPLHLEPDNYRDFSGTQPYERQLRTLLEDLSHSRGGAVLNATYRTTYVTAPPLPRNFVERPDEQKSLRQALIADADGYSIALTALEGMGGIGKTILAQALCHDEAIQQAFPDGVLWVTVGRESIYDLRSRINEVRTALGDIPEAHESELTCGNRYRTLMREKAALVIVDDVWRVGDVEPFLAESARSCLLFTTRDTSIAAALGAREHLADLLTPEKAREVFARYSGVTAEQQPPEAARLIEHCGRLPLALAMIGAMLRAKPAAYWKHVLGLLQNADLGRIRAQFPNYPHADLLKTIQVSVEALEPEERRCYLALAVLLEDMAAAPLLQQDLWNADSGTALATAEKLVSLSLAQREADGIRLHDLQIDYVRAQYPNREALNVILGAMRLSANVVAGDPAQFVSQMVGRLLPYQHLPAITQFAATVAEGAPSLWLRPMKPALFPPGTALICTLEGHTSGVRGVALSADGKSAVSASEDHTLKVWDVESGRIINTLDGHSSGVRGVALSADGRRAVSASEDKTLKVWDVESGHVIRTLEGHYSGVQCVALSADGKSAVSASEDRTLKVWDVESGRVVRTLEAHSGWVRGVVLSADGRLAVSASDDSTLKVWDVESGCVIHTLNGHFDRVNCVALSADGRCIVSGSDDDTLKVWDVELGRNIRTLEGHSSGVRGVALSADGKRAVSASDDNTLRVWGLESGRNILTLKGHSFGVNGVALSADGKRAISASHDNTLKVWGLESGRNILTPEGHSEPVTSVVVSADGRRAVSASDDDTLKVWDVESGTAIHTLKYKTRRCYFHWGKGLAFSADGRRAVSASDDDTLKVWDVELGHAIRILEGHSSWIRGVSLSADGRRAISASDDKTLKVWDVDSGCVIRTLKCQSEWGRGLALSADGRRAVSAFDDDKLKVWDVDSGCAICTLEGHSESVTSVTVSADGRRAVSASDDKTLKVWDVELGRVIHTLNGHFARINCVALSTDGKRAISASADKTLRVWTVENASEIAAFTCDGSANCCAFIDSCTVIAGDSLGRVHWLRLEESKDKAAL